MTETEKNRGERQPGAVLVIATAVVATALWNTPQFLRTESRVEHFKREGYRDIGIEKVTESSEKCLVEGKSFDLKILRGKALAKCLNFEERIKASVSPFER